MKRLTLKDLLHVCDISMYVEITVYDDIGYSVDFCEDTLQTKKMKAFIETYKDAEVYTITTALYQTSTNAYYEVLKIKL